MLCEKCGAYMPDDAITCEGCGSLLKRKPQPEPGVRGIRQGKNASADPLPGNSHTDPQTVSGRRIGDREPLKIYREDRHPERRRGVERFQEGAGRPQSRRGIPRVPESQVRKLRVSKEEVRPVRRHMVNWMHVWVGVIVLVLLGIIGGFLYLTRSPAGQQTLARMGRDAPAQAYWQVGESYMEGGQIDKAIAAFLKADEKDPDNVDGLLSLGAAYEAAGSLTEAQALYTRLYEEVSSERPEAYRSQIRLLLTLGREPEAADLMKLAFEKTGMVSFRQQRQETIPETPETDLSAGRYTEEKQVNLTSPQGYDILYLDGDGEFPKDAKPYTGTIPLKEGTHHIQAVCISGDLYSDPLDVTYNVVMPSPDAPKSGLAPGTYENKQRVWLRYPGKEKDITMHYTLDGTTPTVDSPLYTGDPIQLPGGRVTLKAIAVNSFGKVSNVMEVGYKIGKGPVPVQMMYNEEDIFSGFALLETTREAFLQANGEPDSREDVTIKNIPDPCQKLNYSWGHCIVGQLVGQWVVVEVYQTQDKFSAPRGTGVGAGETVVTGKFRDMLQPPNISGGRGLYYDGSNAGKILLNGDGTKSIIYTCATTKSDVYELRYDTKNGAVTAITSRYVP